MILDTIGTLAQLVGWLGVLLILAGLFACELVIVNAAIDRAARWLHRRPVLDERQRLEAVVRITDRRPR